MLFKAPDDKSAVLASLDARRQSATGQERSRLESELAKRRAGDKAERESTYLLNFHFEKLKNAGLIHDLRIEHAGRVAQIDHLVVTRWMDFFILETKHFSTGLKVDEDGQFLRWNTRTRSYVGMASPLHQAQRQGDVLLDLIEAIDWPTRIGLKIMPTLHYRVLISPSARLSLPPQRKGDPPPSVIKADGFFQNFKHHAEKGSPILQEAWTAVRMVSRSTMAAMAEALIAQHRPLHTDPPEDMLQQDPEAQSQTLSGETETPDTAEEASSYSCRSCGSGNLEMRSGRYGYYFRCLSCDKNTPGPSGCPEKGCKSRIRKRGPCFTLVCEPCALERRFYENAADTA